MKVRDKRKRLVLLISVFLLLGVLAPSGCKNLQSENEKLKGEITDINTENEKLKKELGSLKTENSNMHVRLAQLNLQIAGLQNEIQALQKNLEEVKVQIKGGEKGNRRS